MDNLRSMRTQFLLMMIGASLITLVCVGAVFLKNMIDETEAATEEFKQTLITDVERELKIQTETAISMIGIIHKRQQAGLLTEEQAKTEAAALVRDLRYDDGAGYFWIDTYEGVNVVLLGRKETEGKSRIGLTDPTGKQFIREMIENGRKPGGGFTDLMFAKPNQTEPLPKRNYTAAFEPYRWVVGTGIWIDYIDTRVAAERERSEENFPGALIFFHPDYTVGIGIAPIPAARAARRLYCRWGIAPRPEDGWFVRQYSTVPCRLSITVLRPIPIGFVPLLPRNGIALLFIDADPVAQPR